MKHTRGNPILPGNKTHVAVLLLAHKRPTLTAKVLEAICCAAPPRLYFACDGPRPDKHGEVERVGQVRRLAQIIPQSITTRTLFSSSNQGCGKAVNQAISWFFEHEERGIVLEDDTLPTPSFFKFCEVLLERYAEDNRIGMISGNNHLPSYKIPQSYVFSRHKWTWGWATWRRAWKYQDYDLALCESPQFTDIIANTGRRPRCFRYWRQNIQSLKRNSVNTWDYQWFLALAAQNQLGIVPKHNLVSNVGFNNSHATHTKQNNCKTYTNTTELEFPLQHPTYIVPDNRYDQAYEATRIGDGRGLGRYIPSPLRTAARALASKLTS